MHYYAQIDTNNIAYSITETPDTLTQNDLVEIESFDASLLHKRWNGVAWEDAPKSPIMQLTKLDFLRRFTAEERITTRASTDPIIVDFLHLLDLAQEVRLDDADTQAGVHYLESAELLASGRAEAILAPELA